MGWFIVGLILGGLYGWIWTWLIFGPLDDDETMPADQRARDRWREPGR